MSRISIVSILHKYFKQTRTVHPIRIMLNICISNIPGTSSLNIERTDLTSRAQRKTASRTNEHILHPGYIVTRLHIYFKIFDNKSLFAQLYKICSCSARIHCGVHLIKYSSARIFKCTLLYINCVGGGRTISSSIK